ncbi:hypothetical protein BKA67DRAFT_193834 [Truncatella angustata]|uniref:Uncharacterized protein n=1 Tax=Truncatella angustata TaxID=152316 RepID=A0A9P8USR5_9PEZI|nr:uncharacterized protein BKA67DRAFT_193834 [Truncatella angustata]KAH6657626.1 hypothetical protein BKA67DRAFT_193834 [Truncatella angustata]
MIAPLPLQDPTPPSFATSHVDDMYSVRMSETGLRLVTIHYLVVAADSMDGDDYVPLVASSCQSAILSSQVTPPLSKQITRINPWARAHSE